LKIDKFIINRKTIKRYKGKIFKSEEEAALSFGFYANPLTDADSRERGAVIKRIKVNAFNETTNRRKRIDLYTYGKVFTGGHNHVVFGAVTGYIASWIHARRISIIHTHPNCSGHKPEIFSKGDELVGKLYGVNYMYLASPFGNLFRYDGKEKKRNKNNELVLKPIDSSLPKSKNKCDCRSCALPHKLSKIDAKKILKNNADSLKVYTADKSNI